MLRLAVDTLRGRRHAFAGSFVALTFTVALLTACGVLIQTGERAGAPVDGYAAAPVVVAGRDTLVGPLPDGLPQRLPERRQVPVELAERIAAVDGVRDVVVDRPVAATVAAASGRLAGTVQVAGWSSAALTPYALAAGRAPASGDDVVLDEQLARDQDLAVGDEIRMLSTTGSRRFAIVGLARPRAAGQAGARVFVTDPLAAQLAGDPARAAALGVLLDDGAATARVARRIRALVGDRRVLTGEDRGAVAAPEQTQRNEDLIALGGAFGGTALMLAVFVVAATLGLSVVQRGRELALLRTIGAKPRQVRLLLIGEALVLSLAAGLVGFGPGLLLGAGLFGALRDRGIGADEATLVIGWPPPVIAVAIGTLTACAAAWLAGRRASRIRPTAALAEAALEPPRLGRVRLVLGVAFLAGGAALCAVALSAQGDAAADGSIGVVMVLMVAVGLLGPVLARVAAALVGPAIARLSPTSGFLAQASLRTRARRLAAASTPLALAVAFSLVVVGTLTVQAQATRDQSRERVIADRVLTAPAGLPDELLEQARALPSVTAVTGVLPTEVAAVSYAFDGPTFAFIPAVGVTTGGVARTFDLGVRQGSLDRLAPGTVALSDDRARSLRARVGDRVRLWLGDGRRITPRVVATYVSALGLGDVALPYRTIADHVTNPMVEQALVTYAPASDRAAGDARLEALARTAPGVRFTEPGVLQSEQTEEAAANAWVNYLLLVVLMVFAAVAVVNTLVMATVERRRELSLLRLVGATAAQVVRMIRWETVATILLGVLVGLAVAAATLVPFSIAVAGTAVPYVPWAVVVGVVGLAALLGLGATAVPTRAALRRNLTESITAPQ